MEFDAAQALLDLHNNIREAEPRNPRAESQIDYTEDVVKTANLYMSCFFTSNVKVDPSSRCAETNMRYYMNQISNLNKTSGYTGNTILATEVSNRYNDQRMSADNSTVDNATIEGQNKVPDCKLIRSLEIMLNKHLHERFEVSPATDNIYHSNTLPSHLGPKQLNITTRDMGIQTIENNQSYKIKIMESTIKHLSDRIKILETQINATQFKPNVLKDENQEMYKDKEVNLSSNEIHPQRIYSNKYCIKTKTTNVKKSLTREIFPCENDDWRKENNTSCKIIKNVEPNDLVPIGKGRALVSARLLRHINWNSYTSATRKLLTAIFSRRVLATHSLTGKRSPAFPKKQPKKKLDVDLVQDIVQTVVDRCSVPENVVRTSITTKCADESKMYRTRMLNRKLKYRKSKENISSEMTDSDDSLC